MRVSLDQPLVVENVTGAAGTIGVGRVARAAPDGYTLSVGHWSTHVINGAIYPLPFDLLKDLEPVALLTSYPMLLVSKNAVPAKDLKELIVWLVRTDKVSVGSIGVGSAAHIAGVHFESLTGLKLQYVPYRGAAPALQDLMGGQIDILFDHLAHSLPHVREGKIRAYAVTAQPAHPRRPLFLRSTKPACRSFTCPSGTGCGRRRARRRTSSPSLMPPSWMRWPIPACVSGSPTSARSSHRASSRRRKHLPHTTRPRSRSGGQSYGRPTSRWNERDFGVGILPATALAVCWDIMAAGDHS